MKNIYLGLNIIFSAISLCVFLAPLIPPSTAWVFGFLAFFLPVFVIFNFFQLIILVIHKSYLTLLPGILLLWSIQFFPEIYQFQPHTAEDYREPQITVLSYNSSYFRKTPHWQQFRDVYLDPDQNQSAIQAKAWLKDNPADIYCFQEFYNDADSEFYDILQTIGGDSSYNKHLSGQIHPRKPIMLNGIATVSKFPILKKGEVFIDNTNAGNRSIFTDILLGTDTVRIINLHFHSMMIDRLPADKNFGNLVQYVYNTFQKVKAGLIIRENQAQATLNFILNSPYPVLVAGDFNEIPYGYVYNQFSNNMKSAYANAGRGFGFTLNTNLPYLRIDHHFYSPDAFEALHFDVLRDLTISEHYPVQSVYRFMR